LTENLTNLNSTSETIRTPKLCRAHVSFSDCRSDTDIITDTLNACRVEALIIKYFALFTSHRSSYTAITIQVATIAVSVALAEIIKQIALFTFNRIHCAYVRAGEV
jgi:hypothetical protein